jgi:hypothetical protein
MLGILSKLFGGNKSDKDVKKIQPIVEKTNQYFASYASAEYLIELNPSLYPLVILPVKTLFTRK